MDDTTSTPPAESQVLTTFATMWSIASLFHIASYDHWDRGMLIIIAVVWLLLKPSSAPRLALLAASQVTVAALFSPFISNHWLFTAFVNLSILASFGAAAFQAKTVRVTADALYELFAPAARWMLIVLYFYVVFHKLNADFFSLDTSCGTDFYAHHLQRFPFLVSAPWASWAVIFLTVIIEAIIPALWISRRTRHWGVMLGMLFHAFIAFNPKSPFYNFSSMLFAAYTLFLPPNFRDLVSPANLKRVKVGVVLTVLAIGLTMFDPPGSEAPLVIFAAYAIGVIAVVFATLGLRLGQAPLTPRDAFGFKRWWLAAFPLALLANGFMPYLGLKTETSLAMYSNLRTELGQINHFIVGKGFEVFDYQHDFVRIVHSSNPILQDFADRGLLISWFELHRFASELRDFSITYERDGKTVVLEEAADDPELGSPIPLWKQKFLYFRPIDNDPRQRCYH